MPKRYLRPWGVFCLSVYFLIITPVALLLSIISVLKSDMEFKLLTGYSRLINRIPLVPKILKFVEN